jgi:DivIVA domain-containing protein
MDSPKPNDQAGGAPGATKSSIDSLRTVEFRTTIRGYHMDDVDEYLERVAVEAEGLQEQSRLSADRVKQALERVTSLEQQLEQARRAQQQMQASQQSQQTQPVAQVVERDEPEDESLKRTLMLAQKFVDQTRQEAEEEARTLLAESESRARVIVADAEEHARVMTESAERKLREEVERLDTVRTELSAEIDAMTRRLDSERAQIRKSLTEMLSWVDEKVKPASGAATSGAGTGFGGAGSGFGMARGGSGPDSGSATPRASREASAPAAQPATPVPAETSARETTAREARTRDTSGFGGTGGPPTERMPVASMPEDVASPSEEAGAEADDAELEPLGSRDGSSILTSRERLLPGHQREMFAPGLQSNQAGSGAAR